MFKLTKILKNKKYFLKKQIGNNAHPWKLTAAHSSTLFVIFQLRCIAVCYTIVRCLYFLLVLML